MTTADIINLITALAAFAAALGAYINGRRIHSVHLLINSRLDQLLRLTGTSEFARGKLEGDPKSTLPH